MDERLTRRILDRLKRTEKESIRRSIGVVTSADPLAVTIDGQSHTEPISTLGYVPVIGDRVWISRSSNDLVIHNAVQFTQSIALTFATGWANLGGEYADAEFYKSNGRVYLRGTIAYSSGGSSTIATLPVGYRPPASVSFPVAINTTTGALKITSAGVITDATFSANSKAALFLNGVNFRVTD